MPLFKKAKKISARQKFYNDLMEEIVFAIDHGKHAIYIPINEEKEEDWLLCFAEEKEYFVRADHTSEKITYYKIWGWGIEDAK